MKTEISVILQIASLHPEHAPGAAELRPLAASTGQERVPPWPIKTLPTNGVLIVYFCDIQFNIMDNNFYKWDRLRDLMN